MWWTECDALFRELFEPESSIETFNVSLAATQYHAILFATRAGGQIQWNKFLPQAIANAEHLWLLY